MNAKQMTVEMVLDMARQYQEEGNIPVAEAWYTIARDIEGRDVPRAPRNVAEHPHYPTPVRDNELYEQCNVRLDGINSVTIKDDGIETHGVLLSSRGGDPCPKHASLVVIDWAMTRLLEKREAIVLGKVKHD